jgi:hypothetical protein
VDEDPARFVPAEVLMYARLEGAAGFLDAKDGDPLARKAWRVIQGIAPAGFWRDAAPRLGLSEREVLEALFAHDVVVVDQALDGRRAEVVLARVDEDLLRRLPEAAGCVRLGSGEQLGAFEVFANPLKEGGFVLARSSRWLAFTSIDASDHLRRLLTARAAGEPALATNDGFLELMARLPAERSGTFYTRSVDGSERHAVVLVREPDRLVAHYAGRVADAEKYVDPLSASEGVEFGPLPADVLAAGTVNVFTRDVPGESFLDLLLFPHSFRDRVLPRLSPPLLVFLGQVPGTRIDPRLDFTVPVLGAAVRLKDPSVAEDLDRIASGAHFLVAVTRLKLLEGFFGVEEVEWEGGSYHVADFGPIVRAGGPNSVFARLASIPGASSLTRLAYGVVGDYYLVCTQEHFLRACADLAAGNAPRLAAAPDFASFGLEERNGLVVSGVIRGRELAALLRAAGQYIERVTGIPVDSGEKEKGTDDSSKRQRSSSDEDSRTVQRPLDWIASGLEDSRSFALQLWYDGGALHGKVVIAR